MRTLGGHHRYRYSQTEVDRLLAHPGDPGPPSHGGEADEEPARTAEPSQGRGQDHEPTRTAVIVPKPPWAT